MLECWQGTRGEISKKIFCAIDQNFVDICHRECMTVQCLPIHLTELAFHHIAIGHGCVVDLMKKNYFLCFSVMLICCQSSKRQRGADPRWSLNSNNSCLIPSQSFDPS